MQLSLNKYARSCLQLGNISAASNEVCCPVLLRWNINSCYADKDLLERSQAESTGIPEGSGSNSYFTTGASSAMSNLTEEDINLIVSRIASRPLCG